MSSRNQQRWYWILLFTLVVLGLPAGCQEETTQPTVQSDVLIEEFEIEEAALAAGESTELRVWVVGRDGGPAEGIPVSFSEFPEANGPSTFSKDEELSDATGLAKVTYTAPGSAAGEVTLKVQAGGDVAYRTLQVGAGGSTGINLRIVTQSGASALPADGSSSVVVTLNATQGLAATPVSAARVTLVAGDQFLDADGNGVFSNGDQVLPAGDLDGDGSWDAEGSLPEQVTTDAQGNATFVYQAGEHEGNVYIKATMAGATKELVLLQHSTSVQVAASASSRELLADGVSETAIRGSVSDWGGAAIEGVILRFVAGEPFTDTNGDGYYTAGTDSYSDTDENGRWDAIGSIQSVATTGPDGSAYVSYTAGLREGPVTIHVSSSSGSGATTVNLVRVPPAWSMEIELDEDVLPADGISLTRGTVRVYDVNGASVSGKEVRLVAGEKFDDVDGNGVYTPSLDTLLDDADGNNTWTAFGTIPSSVFTNVDGIASFEYTAGLAPAEAWVRASADGVSLESRVALEDLPTAWTIQLSASANELSVQGAGGTDNVVLTATAFDALQNPVPAGIPVSFAILGGPAGGEVIQGASGGIYTTRTNGEGQATCILRAGSIPGLVRVQATSGTTARQLDLVIGAGPAASLSGRSLSGEVEFWSETEIEVFVADAFGNPVSDGTAVEFSVDEGAIVGQESAGISRTAEGRASALYRALGPSEDTDNLAVVIARVPGTTATTTFEIPLLGPTSVVIEALEIATSRTEISVQGSGGFQEAVISVQALDTMGRPVGSGFDIDFAIVEGPLGGESLNRLGWGPVTARTNGEGVAQVTLRSGNTSGPIEVEASYEDLTAAVHVGMAAGDVLEVECLGPSNAVVGVAATITAFVYDENHNSVPDGTVVWFYASDGLIDGAEGGGSSLTVNGQASAQYTATPNAAQAGLAEISVTASNANVCRIFIDVSGGPDPDGELTNLELTTVRSEVGVRGTGEISQTVIRAQGVDANGDPVGAGVPVTFEILVGPDGGETFLDAVGPVTTTTNASGIAQATLVAGTVSGTIVVQATSGTVASGHANVAVAAGPPANIYVGAELCNVAAARKVNVENAVVVLVSDTYNNPVRNGTSVYFTVDHGVIRGGNGGLGSDVTSEGEAGGVWLSNGYGGIVTVTASTAGGDVIDQVSFISSDVPYSAEILSPTSEPVRLPANGTSQFSLWVEVLDWNGMFVLPTELFWEVEYGRMAEEEESADGCATSVSRGVYQSNVLEQDFSVTTPDDGIGAIDFVTVGTGYGGVSDQIEVHLTTGRANADESEMEFAGSVLAGESVNFTVTIKDRSGNPLGGHTFSATASDGTVSSLGPTDSYGQAVGTFTAPDAPGSVTVVVVDTDPNYGGLILSQVVTVQ